MASLNRVQLIGRVGRDPETRYTSTQTAVASFSLATSEKVKDEERTEWHQVSVFGKTAELVDKYVRKGALIYLDGRLQSRVYTDKAGVEKKVWEVIADRVVFLDTKRAEEQVEATSRAVWQGGGPGLSTSSARPGPAPAPAVDDDPIPF